MKTFSQYVSLGLLIGSAQSAASPLPDTTHWPKFVSTDSPAANQLLSTNFIKEDFMKKGTVSYHLLYGFRNGYNAYPTQKLAKPTATVVGDGSDTAQVLDQGTTTRTFYQTASTELGTYPTAVGVVAATVADAAAANAVNNLADGTHWIVCKTDQAASAQFCPLSGAYTFAKITSNFANGAVAIPKRIYMKYENPTTAITYKTTGSVTAAVAWQYNTDFVIGALYQSDYTGATDTTDGSKWCNGFYSQLKADGTKVTKKATNGFNSWAKCTFQLVAADKTVGPAIKFKKLDYANIFVGWAEWLKSANMGTGSGLPAAADTSDYKIGTYAVDATTQKGLVWVNPVKAGLGTNAWKDNAYNPLVTDKNPVATFPGNKGKVAYYFQKEGQFKDEQAITFGVWVVEEAYMMQKSINDAYDSAKNTFNGKADTYNVAAKAEVTRTADFFKATFEAKVAVPTRPCAPTRPGAWAGYMLDYARYITGSKTWATTATAQGKYLGIVNDAVSPNTYATSTAVSNRLGYLRAAKDSSATTVDQISHVFGLLGQGAATDGLDGSAMPFMWEASDTADMGTVMVTISGGAKTENGLDAATKFIEIEGKGVKWATYDKFMAPSQPGEAKALEKDPNASSAMTKAVSSLLAASVVMASLY